MYTVEGLGKIYKVHIERSLPFGALFNNNSQHKNVVHTASSSSEPCVFFSKLKVHSQWYRCFLIALTSCRYKRYRRLSLNTQV